MNKEQSGAAARVAETLKGLIDVAAVYTSKKEIVIKGYPLDNSADMRSLIESRLAEYGRLIAVYPHQSSLAIRIARERAFARPRFPWLNLILFVSTIISTLTAGAYWAGGPWSEDPMAIMERPLDFLLAGVPFSLSLLAILLFHEFGHYIAARRQGVDVSLPYFIPAPIFSPFGTLGALIISKSPFINRKQLLDVGAAGPLAGLLAAIIVLFIGIHQSSIEPITQNSEVMYIGESLLFKFITYMVKGPIPETGGLYLSSTALAGWVGTLVTMFNLLPLGQLDGGRIVYALFGHWQKTISKLAILGLAAMSFFWTGWVLWMFIGFFLKASHPPTILDEVPLNRGRILIGILSIAAFIICFIPVPVRFE